MFKWDEAKNAANIRKHGIGFARAAENFDGFVLTESDDRFEHDELREIASACCAQRLFWLSSTPIETHGHVSSLPVKLLPRRHAVMKPPYERGLTLEELAQRSDDHIDTSDIPELGEEFWRNARWVGPHERKRQMTIRFDADIVDWCKAQGKGYQSRMNAVLRAMSTLTAPDLLAQRYRLG